VSESDLPSALATIRDDFLALEQHERLVLLLEFANELPELPPRYADHPDLLERVEECQSPVFIFVDVDDDVVHLHATAPKEAPTTRGFASILAQGLAGLTVDEVLGVPDDYPLTLGRTKRQVREKTAA
jgi:cysteine desulfuration protein SufE